MASLCGWFDTGCPSRIIHVTCADPTKVPMTLNISAIDHLQVTVPPALEKAAMDFYGRVLGLNQIEKPAPLSGRGGAWYQVGSCQMHLSLEPDPRNESSKRHVCYLVPDLDEAKAKLIAEGLTITDETTEPNGLKRFFVRDPANNRVEIGQHL